MVTVETWGPKPLLWMPPMFDGGVGLVFVPEGQRGMFSNGGEPVRFNVCIPVNVDEAQELRFVRYDKVVDAACPE